MSPESSVKHPIFSLASNWEYFPIDKRFTHWQWHSRIGWLPLPIAEIYNGKIESPMPPQRNDYSDLAAIMQTAISPLTTKLQAIDDKVNALSQNRVTRSDIEKLRTELVGSMVPRDAYEPRHLAMVERQTTLENTIREERKDRNEELKAVRVDVEQDLQRVHERLESGKQQIEDRIKEQQNMSLSDKDRLWIRWNQVVGFVGIALAVLDWLAQHVKFN